jgi:membrane protein implicated in regulation of membrane protease activity
MLTFALISFLVVTFNIFLSTVGSFSAGSISVEFTALDSAVMAVYLGATFSAYVSRRWTDRRYMPDQGEVTAGGGSADGPLE